MKQNSAREGLGALKRALRRDSSHSCVHIGAEIYTISTHLEIFLLPSRHSRRQLESPTALPPPLLDLVGYESSQCQQLGFFSGPYGA